MAEYRVTALYYRFTSEIEYDLFDKAVPTTGELGPFSVTLADGVVKAIPSVEFRDRQAARDALEPYLRDWEQGAFLSPHPYRIRFEYERSGVEEVDPKPGMVNVFPETAAASGSAFGAEVVTHVNREYPAPDPGFRRSELTERLTTRLRRARDGEETWPAFAYFVLSTLENEFGFPPGNRPSAARVLAVEPEVLGMLGRITARPDPEIGRKAATVPVPITAAEKAWLQAAMVRLIRRVGEHAAGGTVLQITMADLPPLP